MIEQIETHPTIVVVDDERGVVAVLRRLLSDFGNNYDVITASSAAEALAHIEGRNVALVITDYNMAGMDGLQLAEAIKQRTPSTGVVLITAYASPDLERRAKARVDYFLTKPFALDALEQIVDKVIAA